MLQLNRVLARGLCTLCDWSATEDARGYVRRFIRYQVLYYFVLIEYFLREDDPSDYTWDGKKRWHWDVFTWDGIRPPGADRYVPKEAIEEAFKSIDGHPPTI